MKLSYILCACVLFPAALPAQDGLVRFGEVWAYLMAGEEAFLAEGQPVTDVGYFGAGLNSSGELSRVPDIRKIGAFPARKHLVVAEVGNQALTHFALSPDFPIRDKLVADIAAAAEPYDGVQIDFEMVPAKDKDAFFEFLRLLKDRIDGRTLSAAVPARWRDVADAYDYALLDQTVDRVIVMAYDEHWSTSGPGPIASVAWGRNVAAYATRKISPERLVMGLPFYGRAWADKNLSRAYKHSGVAQIIEGAAGGVHLRENEIPSLEYQETVTVRLFYEDASSILSKLRAYAAASVRNVAFWRLGQEDPAVWPLLEGFPAEPDAQP